MARWSTAETDKHMCWQLIMLVISAEQWLRKEYSFRRGWEDIRATFSGCRYVTYHCCITNYLKIQQLINNNILRTCRGLGILGDFTDCVTPAWSQSGQPGLQSCCGSTKPGDTVPAWLSGGLCLKPFLLFLVRLCMESDVYTLLSSGPVANDKKDTVKE